MLLCYVTVLSFVTSNCVTKLKGAMSRTVAIICTVSQLTANYPYIIAVHGDNLNVGTYPDPFSSPNEKSGPRVQKRTSDYSDGVNASCMHSF